MVLCVESLIAKQGSESITRYENLRNTDRGQIKIPLRIP
jgi:hypothetical protein